MILKIVLAIIVILATIALARVIKAARLKARWVRKAKDLGYKVAEYPNKWIGAPLYTEVKRQEKVNNDAHYHYKHELASFDIVVSNIFLTTVIQISHPRIVKEYFKKANEGGIYVKHDLGISQLERLFKKDNILVSEGKEWKKRRGIIDKACSLDFMHSKIDTIHNIVKKVLDDLDKNFGKSSQMTVGVKEPTFMIYSKILNNFFFPTDEIQTIGGKRIQDVVRNIITLISEVGGSPTGFLLGAGFGKLGLTAKDRQLNSQVASLKKHLRTIVINSIKSIHQRKVPNPQPTCIIEFLMKTGDLKLPDQGGDKGFINIDTFIDEYLTIYTAGTGAPPSLAQSMIYRLAAYPDILMKVRAEFEKQVPNKITLEKLSKGIPYYRTVLKQALRMDSGISSLFVRQALSDNYLGDLQIPKGMRVITRLRLIHYNPALYPDPHTFNPDRWSQEKPKTPQNEFTFIPMSHEDRTCFGTYLNNMCNKIILIEFLKRYKELKLTKPMQDIKWQLPSLYTPEEVPMTLTRK